MATLTRVNEEFEHNSLQEAQNAAYEDAVSSGGRVFPCVVFRQGARLMITTSFPYSFLQKNVQRESAERGESPRSKTNRPLLTDHVRVIQNYMRENANHYIMPPVTLNVRQFPQLHVPKTNAAVRSGYLVVDDSTTFYVTDGQHRIAAIAGHHAGKKPTPGIIDIEDDFRDHGIAVQIVFEPQITNIHQDFADAAQTKPIPASLLATYNMREPVNRVLSEIVENSFLNGRVEETSKTLPKMSQYMFLLNQVRGFIKELLVRDYAMADTTLDRLARERLGTDVAQAEFVNSALHLLDILSVKMVPWTEIRSLPRSGDATNRIPDFRLAYINMTATGLVIIGRAAHIINKTHSASDEREVLYTRLATDIDWRRDAEIWRGNIVNREGKVQTQRSPVKLAANAVLERLGLNEANEEDWDRSE